MRPLTDLILLLAPFAAATVLSALLMVGGCAKDPRTTPEQSLGHLERAGGVAKSIEDSADRIISLRRKGQ